MCYSQKMRYSQRCYRQICTYHQAVPAVYNLQAVHYHIAQSAISGFHKKPVKQLLGLPVAYCKSSRVYRKGAQQYKSTTMQVTCYTPELAQASADYSDESNNSTDFQLKLGVESVKVIILVMTTC